MAGHWVTIDGRHVLIEEDGGHDGTHDPAIRTGNKTTDAALAKGTPNYNRSLQIRLQNAEIANPDEALSNYNKQAQKEWLGGEPPVNGKLRVYRASPNDAPIRPGDYVTNSYSYAKLHMQSNLGGEGKIQSVKATLADIHPADGPKEFWYYPKKKK